MTARLAPHALTATGDDPMLCPVYHRKPHSGVGICFDPLLLICVVGLSTTVLGGEMKPQERQHLFDNVARGSAVVQQIKRVRP